jgi:nucleoside-diphosphate-sugar epimerase
MIVHSRARAQKPARVVVLGARGFIGGVLLRHLRTQGVATDAPPSADLDLANPSASDALSRRIVATDVVVMLSALTPDKGRGAATLMKNLAMMQTVCAAVQRVGCSQMIYFSSDAVYASGASRVTEDTPASPGDLYGAMHYMRELMARSLTSIPVLVLRPTLVYGLDDTHNAYGPNRFRRMAQKEGKIALFGGGEEMRDHIHVDDVVSLTVRCMLLGSTGTLNVATGTSSSFLDVARLVAAQFATPVEVATTPRTNPITHRHYDVTHLIKAFPDFRFIRLEQGVARVHHETMEAPGA